MTCLHLHPKDLRIPDWELQQDAVVVVCLDCGKVLDIRFLCSQSTDTLQIGEILEETLVETAY